MWSACGLVLRAAHKSEVATVGALATSFHTSTTVNNFPQNNAKRRQRRKMYRTAAKNHGVNPNMSNAMIRKHLQMAGHMQVCKEKLVKWELEKLVSPQERHERREKLRDIITHLEGKPAYMGGPRRVIKSEEEIPWPEFNAATKAQMEKLESILAEREKVEE